jgi:hypothetical protein
MLFGILGSLRNGREHNVTVGGGRADEALVD